MCNTCGCKEAETFGAYDDSISERQEWLIGELGGKVDNSMNRSKASDYIKKLQGKESGTWKDAESKFDELSNEIAEQYEKKGKSKEEAEKIGKATAYKVGVAKYGKRGMTNKAKAGMRKKKMRAEGFGAEVYGGLMSGENALVMMNLTGLEHYQVGFDNFGMPLHRLDDESQKELVNKIKKRAKQRRSKRGQEEARLKIKLLKDNDFTFVMDDEYADFGAESKSFEAEEDFMVRERIMSVIQNADKSLLMDVMRDLGGSDGPFGASDSRDDLLNEIESDMMNSNRETLDKIDKWLYEAWGKSQSGLGGYESPYDSYPHIFGADEEAVEQTDANMVNEGSVEAFYGGGAKVSVSSAGIQPTANPSVDEAFNVGNQVGLDVAEQEIMNENPSVEVNYGGEDMSLRESAKLGFGVGAGMLGFNVALLGIATIGGFLLNRD